MQDKVVGISFRRCDQLKSDVISDIISKVIHSKPRFGLTHRFEVHLDHGMMPAGNGK